jgi:hypothetical protein
VLVSSVLLVSFFAPLLLWMGIVVLRTGSFYSPETRIYHEFVWLYQRLGDGPVAYARLVAKNFLTYVDYAVHASLTPVVLIACLVVFFFRASVQGYLSRQDDDTRKAVIFFIAADVIFYASMGFYAERIAWTIVPALLVVLGLQLGLAADRLTGHRRSVFRLGESIIAIGSVFHVIFRLV